MKLRAGELRERIEFWKATAVQDANVGGSDMVPVLAKGPVPAKLAPQGGFQRTEASAANSIGRKSFWIRWTTGITPDMWVKHNGVEHTIVLVEVVEHREVLAVHCEVRDGGST